MDLYAPWVSDSVQIKCCPRVLAAAHPWMRVTVHVLWLRCTIVLHTEDH